MSAAQKSERPVAAGRIAEDSQNEAIMVTAAAADKTFSRLRAQFALAGHELHRTDGKDGQVRYFASRWGASRLLDDLDEVAAFLKQVSGGAA